MFAVALPTWQEILAEERSGRQEEEVVAGLRRRVASRKEMTEARAQRNTDEFEKACREEARVIPGFKVQRLFRF